MLDGEQTATRDQYQQRIADLERRVAEMERMLADMRGVFTEGFDVLAAGNDNRRQAIADLTDRFERGQQRTVKAFRDLWAYAGFLGDAVAPMLERIFPGQGVFREELNAHLTKYRPRG